MRVEPRSLWRVYPDTVCANSPEGLYPGCPEGFVALETSTARSVARTARKAEKTQGLEE